MIENGDIFAQIDDTAGMVRFSEDPEDYSSTVMLAHLDKQLARSVDLAQRLQHVSNLVCALLKLVCRMDYNWILITRGFC